MVNLVTAEGPGPNVPAGVPLVPFVMIQDDPLRAIQRQNDLKAWLEYERMRLRAAYAQIPKSAPRKRWMQFNPGWRSSRRGEFDAPR